jgi:hypothetical protein
MIAGRIPVNGSSWQILLQKSWGGSEASTLRPHLVRARSTDLRGHLLPDTAALQQERAPTVALAGFDSAGGAKGECCWICTELKVMHVDVDGRGGSLPPGETENAHPIVDRNLSY